MKKNDPLKVLLIPKDIQFIIDKHKENHEKEIEKYEYKVEALMDKIRTLQDNYKKVSLEAQALDMLEEIIVSDIDEFKKDKDERAKGRVLEARWLRQELEESRKLLKKS